MLIINIYKCIQHGTLMYASYEVEQYFSMKQLCYLFGMEVIFNLLRWPLEDRVDNGTVDLTETSPHYAVI